VLGLDLSELGNQFEQTVPGRVLLLDADGAAYRAAATAKTLPTVVKRFITEVLTDQFIVGAAEVRVHLTGQGGAKAHRPLYPTAKPYQGNRKNKAKPPLLEPLRELLGTPERMQYGVPEDWYVQLHRFWEADDACTQDSVEYGDRGVVKSDDKDLRLCRGPYWEVQQGRMDIIDNQYGWISDDYTPSLKLKVKGHGTKFFWAQMLMGDKADHIQGLAKLDGKLIGEAGTLEFLEHIDDENEAANKILWAYARNGQDALAEAQVLWMRRSLDDCAHRYLTSLELDGKLRAWVDSLHAYHQKVLASKQEEREHNED
jgi:hypothetical protein